MTATADMIIERRKARRALTFWRILAIFAVIVALVAVLPRVGGGRPDHIARVKIEGVIFHQPEREHRILDIAEDDSAKALIVWIESPGGTLVGSEALYDALRKVAEKKPVVAVMSEVAASGGYLTALGADRVIARRNTLTGSIGVILQAPNFAGLLNKVGIEVTEIKSAPLKAAPSLVEPVEPEAIRAQEVLIEDAFGWFRDLVAERRQLAGERLAAVTDGRVLSGRQARDLGLIDAIGDGETAKAWLEAERGLEADLPVIDRTWTPQRIGWPLDELQDATAALSGPNRLLDRTPRLYAIMR